MTKIFKKLAFLALTITAATAIASNIADINKTIQDLINANLESNQKVNFEFTKLETNEFQTLSFGLKANLWAKSLTSDNELNLKLEPVEYEYNNGIDPTLKFGINLTTDLTKILTREEINDLAQEVESIILNVSSSFLADYGDAATVTTQIDQFKKDSDGNVTEMSGNFRIKINKPLLPEDIRIEDVPFEEVFVTASVTLTNIQLNIESKLNPLNRHFKQDEVGLKEYLDKVINKDPSTLEAIAEGLNTMVQYLSLILK
jgi:hypothetical protein